MKNYANTLGRLINEERQEQYITIDRFNNETRFPIQFILNDDYEGLSLKQIERAEEFLWNQKTLNNYFVNERFKVYKKIKSGTHEFALVPKVMIDEYEGITAGHFKDLVSIK